MTFEWRASVLEAHNYLPDLWQSRERVFNNCWRMTGLKKEVGITAFVKYNFDIIKHHNLVHL